MNNVNRSSSNNNFICEICGSSYSRAEFLRRHSRSAHQKEAGKTFHCTHCNKSFARRLVFCVLVCAFLLIVF